MLPLTRWRWPLFALLAAAVTAFAGCAGFDTLDEHQRRWIFNARPLAVAPSADDAVGPHDVWIEHASRVTGTPVRLRGLWLPNDDPQAPVLLYLHGAGRSLDQNSYRAEHLRELGFTVLGIDYRGFGRSTAELPSEAAVYEDARVAWEWLAQKAPGRPRYLFGHSLGGAIAIHLATEVDDARGLIVEGTFTSIPEVFQTTKWGWLPVTALITQRFDSIGKIDRVRAPLLVVHGSRDGLIRPQLARSLYERARVPKRFVLVEGGTHYSTNRLGGAQYREALKELFGLGS
ncbi:MAG TPA: alpha/beta fold hydrolase [Gemmatimonadales bacterium]|nr:alpha/beta fold hydrolase [Gemmatimonadales bacterium]